MAVSIIAGNTITVCSVLFFTNAISLSRPVRLGMCEGLRVGNEATQQERNLMFVVALKYMILTSGMIDGSMQE